MSITEKLAVTYERKVDMHFCQLVSKLYKNKFS